MKKNIVFALLLALGVSPLAASDTDVVSANELQSVCVEMPTPVPEPQQLSWSPAYGFFDEAISFCTWTCHDGSRGGSYVASEGACSRACRSACGTECFLL